MYTSFYIDHTDVASLHCGFYSVNQLVLDKVSYICKLVTQITLVRLLTIVDSLVRDKGLLLCELLITKITLIWLLSSVDSLVHNKGFLLRELRTTKKLGKDSSTYILCFTQIRLIFFKICQMKPFKKNQRFKRLYIVRCC